tara:strand:- start:29026 stop:29718 length:693 start_codon:yes stop_codon:yes gene_type:complete
MILKLISLFEKKFILSLLGFILFTYGCGVGMYKWFPFQIIKRVSDLNSICDEYPYSKGCVVKTEQNQRLSPTSDIKFALSEVKKVNLNPTLTRNKLLKRVILPKKVINISKISESSNKDIITASMYGIKNVSILSKSKIRGKCLNIYIQGHQGNPFKFDYHEKILENSNNKGCDFLSFSMLGICLNKGSASFPAIFGDLHLNSIEAHQHENYAYFLDKNNPDADPLALFL